MNDAQLQPYLNFNGNCEEAMKFYQSVLGGELQISRFADYESPEMPVQEDQRQKVMHSTLQNKGLTFMASDAMNERAASVGNNITLSVAGTETELLTKFFNGLSEGGTNITPLAQQVWGDTFGMFTDKFGINWMFNISASKEWAMGVVTDYLNTLGEAEKNALERIQAIVTQIAPEAEEVITYGMPGYKYKGKYLISFAAFKDHLSIFPGAEAIEALKDKLEGFALSKGTIQFTLENQLPTEIVQEIVTLGVKRITAN